MTPDKYSLKGLFKSEQQCYRIFGANVCEGRLMLFALIITALVIILATAPIGQRYLASLQETVEEVPTQPVTVEEWYFSALTARQQFEQIRHWVAYLVGPHSGSPLESTLAQFDLGCFAWHEGSIGNPLTCKYVSVMLAQSWMPDFATQIQPIIAAGGSLGTDPSFGGFIMNPANTAWQNYVLNTLIPWVVINGADGLFLDTFGFIDEANYHSQRAGALTLLQRIHSRFPQYFLVMNEGDYMFPEAGNYVDGFVFQNFRLNAQGQPWNPFPYTGQAEAVARVAGTDVKIMTLEAVQAGDTERIQQAYAVACALGMLPAFESIIDPNFVTTWPLQHSCTVNFNLNNYSLRPRDLSADLKVLRDIVGIDPHLFAFTEDDETENNTETTTDTSDETSTNTSTNTAANSGKTPSTVEAPPAKLVALPTYNYPYFRFSADLKNHLLNYLTGSLTRHIWPLVIIESEYAF